MAAESKPQYQCRARAVTSLSQCASVYVCDCGCAGSPVVVVVGGGWGGACVHGVCVCVRCRAGQCVPRCRECRWPKPHSDGQINTSLVSHTILACHEEL